MHALAGNPPTHQSTGRDDTGAPQELQLPVADNEEESVLPQDDAPQEDVPEQQSGAGGTSVEEIDSAVAARPAEITAQSVSPQEAQESEEALQDATSTGAASLTHDVEEPDFHKASSGVEEAAGPESLPLEDELFQPEESPSEASNPEAAFASADEPRAKPAEPVVHVPSDEESPLASVKAPVAATATGQPAAQSEPASDVMSDEEILPAADPLARAVDPASAPPSAAAAKASLAAPDVARDADADQAPEEGPAAAMTAAPARSPDVAAATGTGAAESSEKTLDGGVPSGATVPEDLAVDACAEAGPGGSHGVGVSDPATAQDAHVPSGARADAQRPSDGVPTAAAAAAEEDEDDEYHDDPVQSCEEDPDTGAVDYGEDEDEYYDPKEDEEPAAEDDHGEQVEAEDEDDEEDDDEQEEDDEDIDDYYDTPESLEESSSADAEEEDGSGHDPAGTAGDCSATEPSGCRSDGSTASMKYAREAIQAQEWATHAEAGTMGGQDPGGGKFISSGESAGLSHDVSAADSAKSTAEPGPGLRDEL